MDDDAFAQYMLNRETFRDLRRKKRRRRNFFHYKQESQKKKGKFVWDLQQEYLTIFFFTCNLTISHSKNHINVHN